MIRIPITATRMTVQKIFQKTVCAAIPTTFKIVRTAFILLPPSPDDLRLILLAVVVESHALLHKTKNSKNCR